jgi:acetyl esterase/lipase
MSVAEAGSLTRRSLFLGLAALTASACSRLTFFAANAPTVFGAYQRRTDIAYGDDPLQRLDVYLPDAPSASPRPMVVFWHGGRWEFGDKKDYRFVGAALAELGYVVVVANYRMYPEVKMPGFMEDAARAALWAQAHTNEFNADPARFYLMGHSSGAHMGALLTLDPRYFLAQAPTVPPIAGFIGLSGPYDFLPLREADLQDMFGPPERYPLSQPINFVHRGGPPMLLVQGEKDDTVAPFNALHLAAALCAHDVPVTLRLYPKLSHAGTVAALSELARGIAPVLGDIKTFVNS